MSYYTFIIFFLTLVILFYSNVIRFIELKENTTLQTWNQYFFKKGGIAYSINLLFFIGLLILVSYFKGKTGS